MSEAPETKRCPRCKKTKPVSEFTRTDYCCRLCRRWVNIEQYGNRKRGYKYEEAYDYELGF